MASFPQVSPPKPRAPLSPPPYAQWEILPFKILHTMCSQWTFMKTKWKITGWGLARSPKSQLTSCQVRYEGDMSDHMFSISDYFPSITVQPLDVCKNCTLCIKSSNNLGPLIYWTGRTATSSACLIVCACVMYAGPQRCRHLGLNMTTHLHQVLKLMTKSVYWPVCRLRADWVSTCILHGCLQRVAIPEAVVIQFVLLRKSSVLLETCWGS